MKPIFLLTFPKFNLPQFQMLHICLVEIAVVVLDVFLMLWRDFISQVLKK